MSLSKLSLAQLALKRTFPSLTKDSKVSLREMMYAIGQARDSILAKSIWSKYSVGEELTYDGCISTFKGINLIKEDECLYYFNLPAKPLELPKNMGIYQIITKNNRANSFIPVKSTHYTMYRHSIARGLEGYIGYWQEEDRVYITTNSLSEETELMVYLICESSGIGADDYFPLSPDLEEEVIQRAISTFALTMNMPEDNRTDNAQQISIEQ